MARRTIVNAILMDNPFAIGDLVHIPQGTTLYRTISIDKRIIHDRPMPIKITDKPTVGLVINKSIYDYYIIGIGTKEYMIKSEQINYIKEDSANAY